MNEHLFEHLNRITSLSQDLTDAVGDLSQVSDPDNTCSPDDQRRQARMYLLAINDCAEKIAELSQDDRVEATGEPDTKTTDLFDKLDNVLGNFMLNDATEQDVIDIAHEVNTYMFSHPHPHDMLKNTRDEPEPNPYIDALEALMNELYAKGARENHSQAKGVRKAIERIKAVKP